MTAALSVDDDLALLRSLEVCALAGCTYRQLDFWVRAGLLHSKRPAAGSGTQRLFTYAETDAIRRMTSLVDAGLRPAVAAEVVRHGGSMWLSDSVRIHVSPVTVTVLPARKRR